MLQECAFLADTSCTSQSRVVQVHLFDVPVRERDDDSISVIECYITLIVIA